MPTTNEMQFRADGIVLQFDYTPAAADLVPVVVAADMVPTARELRLGAVVVPYIRRPGELRRTVLMTPSEVLCMTWLAGCLGITDAEAAAATARARHLLAVQHTRQRPSISLDHPT